MILAQEGLSIPTEGIIGGIIAILAAFGLPKLLSQWQEHKERQNETAMGMLKMVIEANVQSENVRTIALTELGSATRELVAKVEALATLIQALEIREANGHAPTELIGD